MKALNEVEIVGLYKTWRNLKLFLIKLRIQIKLLSEKDFKNMLKDEKIDYTQKLYLCYFRYM